MGLREGTPYSQFDSITSGRIYRTKNGLTPMEKPNYVDPQKSADNATSSIFSGGKKKCLKRFKLVIENSKKIKCLSVYVFDESLGNAKKRLIEKIVEKNSNVKLGGLKYSIEKYENGKLINRNNYVFK